MYLPYDRDAFGESRNGGKQKRMKHSRTTLSPSPGSEFPNFRIICAEPHDPFPCDSRSRQSRWRIPHNRCRHVRHTPHSTIGSCRIAPARSGMGTQTSRPVQRRRSERLCPAGCDGREGGGRRRREWPQVMGGWVRVSSKPCVGRQWGRWTFRRRIEDECVVRTDVCGCVHLLDVESFL
jgi:hypothetical protein